jgi:opacity protein-like surface antigen
MKKMIIGALVATLAFNSFAEGESSYVRLDAGISFRNKPEEEFKMGDFKSAETEAKNLGSYNLGLGWYFTEKFRADMNFTYNTDAGYKATNINCKKARDGDQDELQKLRVLGEFLDKYDNVNYPDGANINKLNTVLFGGRGAQSLDISELRIKSFSVVPRLYWNIFDYGSGKLFVGAGVGYANLKAKQEFVADRDKTVKESIQKNFKYIHQTKTSNNLAWSLHAGVDYAVSAIQGVKVNLEYFYSDLGDLSVWYIDNNEIGKKIKIRSHNLTAGLRFDM